MAAQTINVTTTPTLLVSAKSRAQRSWVELEIPESATRTVYIGLDNPTVSPATGRPMSAGDIRHYLNDSHSDPATRAIYAVVSSGNEDVLVEEGT